MKKISSDLHTVEAGTQEPVAWQEIDGKTPRDRFIIMWCREDDSYWWAKWQGGMWHGVDEIGLTRDSENFTPDLWREIPKTTDAAPASHGATRAELERVLRECARLIDSGGDPTALSRDVLTKLIYRTLTPTLREEK